MFRSGRFAAAAIAAAAIAAAVGAVTLGLVSATVAEPATKPAYPLGAAATRYTGLALDTCAAPALATMQAWAASPYRAVGVYIGGVNRTCGQPQLTADWVSEVSALQWRLLPIYKGLQPSCGGKATDQKIIPAQAASQGRAAADDAAGQAQALGMLSGSALYNDIENYSTTSVTCRTAVLTYLSAWTGELHSLGYLAGVYANLSSGAVDLSGVYTSASYDRPDALWVARYDGKAELTGWPGVPDHKWAAGQRAKQYRGSHNETYGGAAVSIDNSRLDTPVATVAYAYTVTGTGPLPARTGPARSYPVAGSYAPGSTVAAVCQAPGSAVGSTPVWDKLSDGTYVTDANVSTPSATGYSAPLPRCRYPYQVTARTGASERSGPAATASITGQLSNGSLAWAVCQAAGTKVGSTSAWEKLSYRHWVSRHDLAAPGTTRYGKPVPRC